jgi:glycosyltransferase involved in cell wall biosynthesis
MKIGYISRWWPEFGGSYQYDLFAIPALRAAAADAELLVFYSDDRLPRDLDHLADSVRFVKLIDGASSPRLFPRIVRRALRVFYERLNLEPIVFANLELKKHRLDACIATSPFVDGVFADCANVLIVHDLWFRRFAFSEWQLWRVNWWSLRAQIAIWNSHVFVVESPLGKHDLQEFGRMDENRVKIIPLPAAAFAHKYMDQNLPPPGIVSKPYVLYPAHYFPFKNHSVTLRALRLLKSKGIRLSAVFCGPVSEPSYRDELVRMATEYDLQDQVVFEGFLPDRDLAALYQHAAALVMSSKIGPTNMPIWEGMALGTPVISCDLGDMPWQVGDAGLIFPVDDEQILASHLEHLISDPASAAEYVRRGKQKFASLRQETWGESLVSAVKEAVELYHADPGVTWKGSDLRQNGAAGGRNTDVYDTSAAARIERP